MTTAQKKIFDDLKAKHPDTLLLFRCGDFYETYQQDADTVANVLGLTLTRTIEDGVLMAGFPHHALDSYLPRLIRAGHRCAICDQLGTSRENVTTVKRGISELTADKKPKKVSKPRKVHLPDLTNEQYELLCECIRYRAADNQREREYASSKGQFTTWYENLETQLDELKQLFYNLK